MPKEAIRSTVYASEWSSSLPLGEKLLINMNYRSGDYVIGFIGAIVARVLCGAEKCRVQEHSRLWKEVALLQT